MYNPTKKYFPSRFYKIMETKSNDENSLFNLINELNSKKTNLVASSMVQDLSNEFFSIKKEIDNILTNDNTNSDSIYLKHIQKSVDSIIDKYDLEEIPKCPICDQILNLLESADQLYDNFELDKENDDSYMNDNFDDSDLFDEDEDDDSVDIIEGIH